MADGSSKPIETLEPGDKVLATDPESGDTVTKDVTASILGEGSKNLVEITVTTDGNTGTAADAITATDKHPFWVVDVAAWVDATDLQPGQWLQTSAGVHVQVKSVKRYTAQHATVHNLTVADLHTYYVLAGAAPVLVHNCGTAQIHQYGVGNDTHFSVEVSDGSSSAHTHLVPNADDSNTLVKLRGNSTTPRRSFTFELPDASSAMEFQKQLGSTGNPYVLNQNDCLTYCASVLRAGGVDAPHPDPEKPLDLIRWLNRNGRKG